ncbi:hypothetical protein OF83DRAFT_1024044, partial [Amylostereum chailletii]
DRDFVVYHWVWWNRYTTNGSTAPDIHPSEIEVVGTRKTNYAQFTPYTSKEISTYRPVYDKLCIVLVSLFSWIRNMLEHYLPVEFKVLSMSANLPVLNTSPVFPFLGLVLNINVSTFAHRDDQDLLYCLVLPLGEYDGGEICLYEQGISVGLESGDIFAFDSTHTTHFNLDY